MTPTTARGSLYRAGALLVVVLFTIGAFALRAGTDIAHANPRERITRLEHRVAELKADKAQLVDQRDKWEAAARTLAGDLKVARAERDEARTQRDQALSGLPDAIRAVPIADFWRLVFTPARETWGCSSYYSSDGYWSLDFQSQNACP